MPSRAFAIAADVLASFPRPHGPPLWGGPPTRNPFPPATGAAPLAPPLPVFPSLTPEEAIAKWGDPGPVLTPEEVQAITAAAVEEAQAPDAAPPASTVPAVVPGVIPVAQAAAPSDVSVSLSPELKWAAVGLLVGFLVSRL